MLFSMKFQISTSLFCSLTATGCIRKCCQSIRLPLWKFLTDYTYHKCSKTLLEKFYSKRRKFKGKLLLLWFDLKSMGWHESRTEKHGSEPHLNLLKKSLQMQDNENLDFISPADSLEIRLRKECSRVCKKYHGLRWGPKDRFRESSTLIMVLENEGILQSTKTSNLVPKLQVNG